MAITGQANINIGEENQAAGSDSLYSAFNKVQNNFTTLFSAASTYTTFRGGDGINITTPSTTEVAVENTGVTALVAGTGVSLSSATGCVTISMANASGNGGTVTSVGLTSPTNTLSVSNVTGNIVSAGVFNVDLSTVANVAGTYFNPNITVDGYGRVTSIRSQLSPPNTLSNVTINPGLGIDIATSGTPAAPVFTVTNSGVTNITAGQGIRITSDDNGVYTVTNLLAGAGGTSGSVTGVTVRTGTNIRLGSGLDFAGANINNNYSSSSNVVFNLDLANTITVQGITTNNITVSNNLTVTNNITSTGPLNSMTGLTVQNLVTANTLVLPSSGVPGNRFANGIPGQIVFASGFLYVCVDNGNASGNWQRATLSGW